MACMCFPLLKSSEVLSGVHSLQRWNSHSSLRSKVCGWCCASFWLTSRFRCPFFQEVDGIYKSLCLYTWKDIQAKSEQQTGTLLHSSSVLIGSQHVSPRILCKSSGRTRPSSPRLIFFTILQLYTTPMRKIFLNISTFKNGWIQDFWRMWPVLPHSWWILMQQLDDITTVKDDVIRAGHGALYHHSVPACHLEQSKKIKNLGNSVFNPLPHEWIDKTHTYLLIKELINHHRPQRASSHKVSVYNRWYVSHSVLHSHIGWGKNIKKAGLV